MITYKFIVCGTDNKTNLGCLSVSNTPFKKNFFKKIYVCNACMHACCKRGIWFFYFFFFFHEQRKRRARERKREKDTKNQMRFSRFYDICGWVEK